MGSGQHIRSIQHYPAFVSVHILKWQQWLFPQISRLHFKLNYAVFSADGKKNLDYLLRWTLWYCCSWIFIGYLSLKHPPPPKLIFCYYSFPVYNRWADGTRAALLSKLRDDIIRRNILTPPQGKERERYPGFLVPYNHSIQYQSPYITFGMLFLHCLPWM